MNKAIFLDKDGTIIKDVPYNIKPNKMRFLKGVIPSLKKLLKKGYKLIIITNQSGIARGLFTTSDLKNAFNTLGKMLLQKGVKISGFYYCIHLLCPFRKPAPGLIRQAAKDLRIDLGSSWMIGDILHDIEAGKRAGCKTILIDNGNETEWDLSRDIRIPDYIVNSFKHIPEIILKSTAVKYEKYS